MANGDKTYDLVVLGGGPAGILASVTAIAVGKTVALVDDQPGLGGAGINTGTVPSKTLRETALALSGTRARGLYGVDLSLRREATVSDFLRHEESVKLAFNHMLEHQLQANHADVYRGFGTFEDPHTLLVRPSAAAGAGEAGSAFRLRGSHFVIATGSSPFRPPIFPFGQPGVYDSDTILRLDRVPKSMAVIGAGVVGSEYACTFAALDTKLHLIDGRDRLLPFLDDDVSEALTRAMAAHGIEFHWKTRVARCTSEEHHVTLEFESGQSLTVEAVLVAAGRKSNTDKLNLAAAGVTVAERGTIPVDARFCTNQPHVYAAGDVIGAPNLASASIEQGRRAALHALGVAARNEISHFIPSGIYTIPEVSTVGETERSLTEQGVEFVVGRARYDMDPRGRIMGERDGFLKLLFRREDMLLLGVQVLGEQATEVVHIGLMALMTKSTADIFGQACFNHPTLAGLYKTATFDAMLRAAQSTAFVLDATSAGSRAPSGT